MVMYHLRVKTRQMVNVVYQSYPIVKCYVPFDMYVVFILWRDHLIISMANLNKF